MQRYVWTFADYLEQRGINPYRVARHAPDVSAMQTIYRLARRGEAIKRLDLGSLALVINAVREETGEAPTLEELLELREEA